MPLESLEDRHILILGGSDGMGYATADYLLRAGSNLTICARTEAKLKAAHDRLLDETGAAAHRLRFMPADACDAAAVEKAAALAADESGALDGVFIVAGGANFVPVTRHTPETMAEEWAMNMFPVSNAITAAVPRMRTAGGSIVALSSGAAARTYPGLSAYGAAKAGMEHYIRVAADELGRYKIRVNAVQPGLTRNGRNADMLANEEYISTFTALTPLGPYGQPEDFAPIVSMLLSDDASWITGQVFAVDGGMSLRAYGGRLAPPD